MNTLIASWRSTEMGNTKQVVICTNFIQIKFNPRWDCWLSVSRRSRFLQVRCPFHRLHLRRWSSRHWSCTSDTCSRRCRAQRGEAADWPPAGADRSQRICPPPAHGARSQTLASVLTCSCRDPYHNGGVGSHPENKTYTFNTRHISF